MKPAHSILFLDLYKTEFDDRGVDYLRGINGFATLLLESTKITDAGLAKLLKQSTFRILFLQRTKITGSGFANLGDNSRTLLQIALDHTRFDDKAMTYLQSCKNLVGLRLNDTSITDAAMPSIASLPMLQILQLRRLC